MLISLENIQNDSNLFVLFHKQQKLNRNIRLATWNHFLLCRYDYDLCLCRNSIIIIIIIIIFFFLPSVGIFPREFKN